MVSDVSDCSKANPAEQISDDSQSERVGPSFFIT